MAMIPTFDLSADQMTLPSPAKLNLFLHIIGQRADGYHLLQTLFQFISLTDTLSFQVTHTGTCQLDTPFDSVALQNNLIYKAAQALLPYRADNALGIRIAVDKKLPMGAGLGGGSSNAATTLLALNKLWRCRLGLTELAQIGLALGADVPIFVHGHSAFAEGVGERLTSVTPPTPYYLIVKPNAHVETGQIFTDKRLTRDTPPIKISHALKLGGHNDCLEVVRSHYRDVNDAYIWLKDQVDVKLTGTGACLFAAFDNQADAERIQQAVPKQWQAWVCHGCNVSPTHQILNQWIEQFGE